MPFTFVGYSDVSPGTPHAEDIEHNAALVARPRRCNGRSASFRQSSRRPASGSARGAPSRARAAGVVVVEAESWSDLDAVNAYYRGWLQFDWHPTRTGGIVRD